MFSFHKPKVYRSISGCCICGAKSSSSRFTDSAKYEVEFQKCFKLHEERSGEICNACVLLVKRWKNAQGDRQKLAPRCGCQGWTRDQDHPQSQVQVQAEQTSKQAATYWPRRRWACCVRAEVGRVPMTSVARNT
ncbi:SIN3-HDAC complex-associated factor-like [Branchiostoma floridae x Branchiostoma japonicum]